MPNNMRDFNIDTTSLRSGQRHALDTIVDRVRRDLTHTAVVLPMRYGKSDVIRVSGIALWKDRLVSHALVLTPSEYLRQQFANADDWIAFFTRYDIPYLSHFGPVIPVYEVDRPPSTPFPPKDAIFAVATTQMVNQHKNALSQWVEAERKHCGVPPVIYIDECETTSENNNWGDCADLLAKAGAFIVWLTATPFRTDRKRIPGFEAILVLEQTTPVKQYRRRHGEELIDVFQGQREVYRLEAHHITTFRDAWDEDTPENPSPLCKVMRRPFEIDLTKLDIDADIKSQAKLSNLPATVARKLLMEILRDPGVIADASRVLVERLTSRRAVDASTAAIVYVGNDEPGDSDVNQHARDVQAAILKLNPSLNIVIATSSDGTEGKETIKAFRNEINWKGDILIVKQMAGRGLDCPRLKVCLDLSNVRAPGPMIQRIGRTLTLWKRGPHIKDWVRVADYICPDDPVGKAVFQRFITDEGGEAVVSNFEYVETIPVQDQKDEPTPAVYLAEGASLPDVFNDSDNVEASGELIPEVEWFYTAVPQLNNVITQPVFAQALAENERRKQGGNSDSNSGGVATQNINDREDEAITRCTKAVEGLTNLIFPTVYGGRYRKGDPEAGRIYGQLRNEVWTRHKQRVGVNPKTDVRDIHDVDILKELRENLEKELHVERHSNRARPG